MVIATRQQSDNLPILGCPAIVPTGLPSDKVVVGTNLYKVTNTSKVETQFLYWLLRGKEYQRRIIDCSKGTTVRMITKDAVEDFCFLCPPLKIRKEITELLDAIDSRISVMRETNTTLEAIAQALFKSWFVDFDPVHAKMQGRAPEGMDEATG
jgi:type I restriction enzyme S subunit